MEGWNVINEWGSVTVRKNSDFSEAKRHEEADGFLYYPFSLEIDPQEDFPDDSYMKAIGKLMEGLWGANCKAVAACYFEEQLPRRGGYQS